MVRGKLSAFLIVLAMAVSAMPAYAIDRDALHALQRTLQEHGFDAGKPDGLMGGKTRTAIRDFAAKYNAPTDVDELLMFMVRRSYETYSPISDEETVERVRLGVGKLLKDPSSAQVKGVKRVTAFDGSTFICGYVNGKNSYGAYAGFVPFRSFGDNVEGNSSQFMSYENLLYILESSLVSYIFWDCELAFPRL